MQRFRIGILAVLMALIAGCAAVTYVDRSIEDERYAAALFGAMYANPPIGKEVARVAEKIKEKAGPDYQNIFAAQTASQIKHTDKGGQFYPMMYRYLQSAVEYKLLNGQQVADAMTQLQRELAASVVADPKIVDEKTKRLFPDLPTYLAEEQEAEFQRALNNELPFLGRYVGAYNTAKSSGKASRLLPVLRTRTAEVANAAQPDAGFLKEMLAAYSATGDAEIGANVKRFIGRVELGKSQLTDEVAEAFPDVAKKEIAKREILIKIVTDSNDPFIDELPEALAAVDEWITVDDDAKRKLNIARLRFNERESGPVIRTLTVQSLDLGTLLVIPRNASVLYDSVSTSYDISWSMSVSDSAGKGSKVISGKNGAQRIECSNVRYRNVFGGEGALSFMPSDIQGYCNSTRSVDFEAMRKDAVRRIAQEIVSVLRAGATDAPKKKAASL